MQYAKPMIETHPHPAQGEVDVLAECIEACYACAQTCIACADACLAEETVSELRRCIRLNMDCADACTAAGAMMSRRTEAHWGLIHAQLEACMQACRICGDECASHASEHEHCRVCADACRRCAAACERALETTKAAI
jgi:hypothetical protein